ncbi:hypothetical protein MVEN_01553600 [Mycena venus]|uniref:Uncharacterized protein n=1 Tax=Mycena venus TaxID=2733690 RepID=A0A8H7CRB1_9AGAR|nr:hypothetical protein MVEN_01553600 [Mycena venus]
MTFSNTSLTFRRSGNTIPKHLTSMETIEWDESLSAVVQCGRFVPLVNTILDYARKQVLFYPSDKETVTAEYHGELCLWERADVRVARFVSDVQPNAVDVPVISRRCLESQESADKEHNVAQVAALVRKWPTNVNFTPGFKLWDHFQRWNSFSSETVLGDKIDNHRFWLEGAPHDVWFRLFHLCRADLNRDRNQYGLMVALGILAYRADLDLDLIRTLLAIATSPTLLTTSLIPEETFNLDPGHTLNLNTVLNITRGNCHDTHPDSSWLERRYGESESAYMKRKRAGFLAAKEDQCEKLSTLIFSHWPAPGAALTLPDMASILPNSSIGNYPIVKIADLRTAAEVLFSTRLCNRRLFEWSNSLQCVLNTVLGHGLTENGLIALLPLHNICVAIRPPKYVPIRLYSLLRDPERSSPPVDVAEQSHPSLRELMLDLEGMPIDGPKTQYLANLSCCVDALDRKGSEPSNSFDGQQDSGFDDIVQRAPPPSSPA